MRTLVLLLLVLPSVAFAQTGGPDTYGYTYGPTSYDWVDVEALGGDSVNISGDSSTTVPLPWDFTFYGRVYDEVYVDADGGLRFSQPHSSIAYTNVCFPATTTTDVEIAPFWDDLSASYDELRMLDDAANDRFVISWSNVPRYSGAGEVSFQVHLHADGAIEFHWADVEFTASATGGNTATIGINDANPLLTGTTSLQLGCAADVLVAGTATRFQPPANPCLDADVDGYLDSACGGDDCDETDPARNPGAAEICDGIDNDCDGVVPADEVDADVDGEVACEDCDDADPANFHGNAEVCDGGDNDCDGATLGWTADDYLWDAPNNTTAGVGARVRGGLFRADRVVTITDFEVRLTAPTTSTLFWSVYEGEAYGGDYTRLLTTQATSSTASDAWHNSGPIDVTLTTGRYYAFVIGWTGTATYDYRDVVVPTSTGWGEHLIGAAQEDDPAWASANPPAIWTSPDANSALYPIRLFTADQPSETEDGDSDGSPACADCDDADPTAVPGGDESSPADCADGVDNDCDGAVDAADGDCAPADDDDAVDDDDTADDDDAADDDDSVDDDDAADDDDATADDDDATADDDDAVDDDDSGDDDDSVDDDDDDDADDDDAGGGGSNRGADCACASGGASPAGLALLLPFLGLAVRRRR